LESKNEVRQTFFLWRVSGANTSAPLLKSPSIKLAAAQARHAAFLWRVSGASC